MDAYKLPDAIILCGGLGTRLKDVQQGIPKILTPVGDKVLLDILIGQIVSAGVNRIILSLGHLSEKVVEYVNIIDRSNIEIVNVIESKPLGTGGALKLACSKSQSDYFLVVNGDSYTDIKPSDLLKFHIRNKSFATMLAVKIKDIGQYGSVLVDSSGMIKSFEEKPTFKCTEGLINAGMYVFNRSILNEIKGGSMVSLEKDIFPSLIGNDFYAYISENKFLDIGTPTSFFEAEKFFSDVRS